MDTLTNAIIVKFQKFMNCETCKEDADIVREATRKISAMPNGQKKLILMTYTLEQFKQLGK